MYKFEIFDENFIFQSAAGIDGRQEIETDYLAPQPSSITLKTVTAKKGWYAHITDGLRVVADGLIADVLAADKHLVTLSVDPLLRLLDFPVFTPAGGAIPDVDTWLADEIRAAYVDTPDPEQTRPIIIDPLPEHPARPLQLDDSALTVTALEVARAAMIQYGVAVKLELEPAEKQIRLAISAPAQQITLEADLDNVLDRSIVLGSSYGGANKMIIRRVRTNKDTGAVSILSREYYYLHTDGTVDGIRWKRITPVFWALGEVEDGPEWQDEAKRMAEAALLPDRLDQEIELTYTNGDKIAQPLQHPLGAPARIIHGGRIYDSILTGRRTDGATATLIFGAVRQDLTKKLRIRS